LIDPFTEKEVRTPVPVEEYEAVVNPEFTFKLTAACRVLGSGRMYAHAEAFDLEKPLLTFDVRSLSLRKNTFICNSVKSFNFVGTNFCGLTVMDMFVDT